MPQLVLVIQRSLTSFLSTQLFYFNYHELSRIITIIANYDELLICRATAQRSRDELCVVSILMNFHSFILEPSFQRLDDIYGVVHDGVKYCSFHKLFDHDRWNVLSLHPLEPKAQSSAELKKKSRVLSTRGLQASRVQSDEKFKKWVFVFRGPRG